MLSVGMSTWYRRTGDRGAVPDTDDPYRVVRCFVCDHARLERKCGGHLDKIIHGGDVVNNTGGDDGCVPVHGSLL